MCWFLRETNVYMWTEYVFFHMYTRTCLEKNVSFLSSHTSSIMWKKTSEKNLSHVYMWKKISNKDKEKRHIRQVEKNLSFFTRTCLEKNVSFLFSHDSCIMSKQTSEKNLSHVYMWNKTSEKDKGKKNWKELVFYHMCTCVYMYTCEKTCLFPHVYRSLEFS